MKTLTKLAASQRTYIPVLSTIFVNDNQVIATDLDIFIYDSAPKGVESGLYHAPGFDKGMLIKADIHTADYPGQFNLGAELGHVNVSRAFMDELAWVGVAQSTEEVRYYLNGICFHENYAIATDGHRLHRVGYAASWPVNRRFDKGMILPRVAFKYVMDMVKEKKPETVTIRFFDNGFQFDIGTARVVSKLVDGVFPDYQRVIPTGHEKTSAFDPLELVPIMKEIDMRRKALGSRRDTLSLGFHKGKAWHTIGDNTKEWKVKFAPEIEIGFNVKFLTESCAGMASYGDHAAPMRIDGDNRLAVIMPLRI